MAETRGWETAGHRRRPCVETPPQNQDRKHEDGQAREGPAEAREDAEERLERLVGLDRCSLLKRLPGPSISMFA